MPCSNALTYTIKVFSFPFLLVLPVVILGALLQAWQDPSQ